jgi:hypothetical protein
MQLLVEAAIDPAGTTTFVSLPGKVAAHSLDRPREPDKRALCCLRETGIASHAGAPSPPSLPPGFRGTLEPQQRLDPVG